MKRVLTLLGAVFMLTNASAQRVNVGVDVDMNGSNGSYQLCVGDVHEVNGVLGIVFVVSKDGRHGKIVSSSQNRFYYWIDAKQWCENFGHKWRLPSLSELQTIYRLIENSSQFWKGLNFAEQPFYNALYWSGDEWSSVQVECLNMEDGSTWKCGKSSGYQYVRAVASF